MNTIKNSIKAAMKACAGLAPRRAMPKEPGRILVLMRNWLGDTFWAMQALPSLTEKWPGAEIWVGTKAESKPLLNGLVPQERIVELRNLVSDRRREKSSWTGFFQELRAVRKKDFDIALDLTGNRYSALFARLCGARFCVGPSDADELGPLYDLEVDIKSMHLSQRPKELASALTGIPFKPDALPFPPKPVMSTDKALKELGFSKEEKIALLLPGAGWQSKRWPAEKFAKLGALLENEGYRVAVAGGASDAESVRSIAARLKDGVALNTPLERLIALLPACEAIVAGDTGLAYIAASFGIKTAIVYCSSNPAFIGPKGEKVAELAVECPLRAQGEGVQHCAIFPATGCQRAEHMSISPEEVVDALKRL